MMADGSNLTLWYGPVLVGTVRQAFQSDGTWFGTLEREVLPAKSPLNRRLLDFIRFCEDWNERTRDNSHPPDAAEFDQYSDLLTSGLWMSKTPEGSVSHIADAPVFFKGDEVTWNVAPRA
jgi:hypothetical protein